MNPLVSVIVPAYNAALTIGETLASILNQSFGDLEVIVIDDGSIDATKNVVMQFAHQDSRVRYIWQTNAKQSAARNRGVTEAHGSYVSALDADDLWHPTKLARQLELIEGNNDLVALTGIRRFLTDEYGQQHWLDETLPPDISGRGRDIEQLILLRSDQMVLFNTALFRREHLLKLGGWNIQLWTAEDWELWLRAAKHYNFATIAEPLQFYRKHKASLTRTQDIKQVLSLHLRIIEQQLQAGVSRQAALKAIAEKYLGCIATLRYSGKIHPALSCWAAAGLKAKAWRYRSYWSELLEIGQTIIRRQVGTSPS